ncbi:glycosyltransferase family 25 protein [Acinetobacter corruptisaponis]|uniref:Glycosyltransferase family 25 protein n=1 Tax=Acinetobacter corruptisaponis TaxID=3045147 RepID=A0ABY8S950_9GAMM|nr:glycosyltransferase family 25 protein [Acinetobacter sp. KCTC 92772]WHP07362.1 glycosyltransferase family 25 protein [Acinetobacter sp. KCTC 92772]
MMKVFLVNLDKRPDRLAFVSKQLDELGIPFERFAAIDGSKLTMETQTLFDVPKFILEQKKKPSVGEVGCAMSHRAIWQKILDEQLDYALILEDDIQIDFALKKLLNSKDFYTHFDFLNISSSDPYNMDNEILNQLISKNILVRDQAVNEKDLWSRLETIKNWKIYCLRNFSSDLGIVGCECDPAPALTSGYIISSKAAEHFLKASEKMFCPIDKVWRYASGQLKQGFLASPLILQSLNDSNIAGRDNVLNLSTIQRIQRLFLKNKRLKRKADVKIMYKKSW